MEYSDDIQEFYEKYMKPRYKCIYINDEEKRCIHRFISKSKCERCDLYKKVKNFRKKVDKLLK